MPSPKFFAAFALAACTAPGAAEPVSLATFLALPRPPPGADVAYGPSAAQSVDVFLPDGVGPYPVAILIHGGCWSAGTAGREQLRPLGARLAQRGIAVWSIGYRRADETGGGFPGTYQDVGVAIDRVRAEAARFKFDLSRNVLVGHSAGGHLALWAIARGHLPDASPLRVTEPFIPASVISLAGIGDLKAFAPLIPDICGRGIAERLIPRPAYGSGDPYAEVSPALLPVPEAHVVMISGVVDTLVPLAAANDYVRAMQARGKPSIEQVDIPHVGHFDLVTPGTAAWDEVSRRIEAALQMPLAEAQKAHTPNDKPPSADDTGGREDRRGTNMDV